MRSGSLCALLWKILAWCTRKQVTQSLTHSRPAERGSRQAIQAKPGHSSGCTRSAMGGSGRIRLPTSSHIGQSGGEVAGLPMQENHSDCSGVAQHALVLGSNGHDQPDPTEPAHSAQPVDTALQSNPSQKSDNLNPHAWLIEIQQSKSRASLRQ